MDGTVFHKRCFRKKSKIGSSGNIFLYFPKDSLMVNITPTTIVTITASPSQAMPTQLIHCF